MQELPRHSGYVIVQVVSFAGNGFGGIAQYDCADGGLHAARLSQASDFIVQLLQLVQLLVQWAYGVCKLFCRLNHGKNVLCRCNLFHKKLDW